MIDVRDDRKISYVTEIGHALNLMGDLFADALVGVETAPATTALIELSPPTRSCPNGHASNNQKRNDPAGRSVLIGVFLPDRGVYRNRGLAGKLSYQPCPSVSGKSRSAVKSQCDELPVVAPADQHGDNIPFRRLDKLAEVVSALDVDQIEL